MIVKWAVVGIGAGVDVDDPRLPPGGFGMAELSEVERVLRGDLGEAREQGHGLSELAQKPSMERRPTQRDQS